MILSRNNHIHFLVILGFSRNRSLFFSLIGGAADWKEGRFMGSEKHFLLVGKEEEKERNMSIA